MSTDDDQMSPAASPGRQSTNSGVRRVNNWPAYIGVSVLAIFVSIIALVANDRAAKQTAPTPDRQTPKGGSTSMFAKEIAGERTDGIVQAKITHPAADANLLPVNASVAIARPPDLDSPPLPTDAPTPPALRPPAGQLRAPQDDVAERIRLLKLQQFDEAVRAPTSISIAAPRTTSASIGVTSPNFAHASPGARDEALEKIAAIRQEAEATTRDDPVGAYKARLRQLQDLGNATEGDALPTNQNAQAGSNDLARFAGRRQSDRWTLEAQPEPPRTPYQLRAGFVVPATLISGINSELPGQIMAQVSQDVYDTPLGRYKLIPQGARLVGSYASEVAFGQSRVLIAWQRIVFPDGKAMDIGAMPGADGAGYAGFRDRVNYHYFRLFSSAFLMSAVTAGVAISQPERGNFNSRPTTSSAMSEALGQQLGQVTAQLISKNLNIAPTLQIRPGYRFNVIVTKDLTFSKPYKAFDY